MLWSCPTCTAPLYPTLVPRSLVAPASFLAATLAGSVTLVFDRLQPRVLNGTVYHLQEYALFEPGCRHVAKDIMGTNRANPSAMILSATMMLRHLGYVFHWIPEILHHAEYSGQF